MASSTCLKGRLEVVLICSITVDLGVTFARGIVGTFEDCAEASGDDRRSFCLFDE